MSVREQIYILLLIFISNFNSDTISGKYYSSFKYKIFKY